ncbi:MAG: hypothetical protein NTZ05_02600, partial [Chloroflexi bacterium]|nr:hypothetical protein [Chloroflexota bacterium]
TGLTAPLAAYLILTRRALPRWTAVVWNVFGMLLLFNIVIRALLSAPTPFRVFFEEPSNTIVGTLPFIWLPAFVVPFALLMHVLSLRQLLTLPAQKGPASPP